MIVKVYSDIESLFWYKKYNNFKFSYTKMDEPMVYIIMPCYNTEKYLLEQLLSIYYQDYKNRFLVFINDGSNDSSWTIIRDFVSHFNLKAKVKIISQKNWWVNDAVNKWLEFVKKSSQHSDLIAFCDSDDIRVRNKLSIQVKYMINNPKCWLVFHDVCEIDENWMLIYKSVLSWRYHSNNTFRKIAIMTHFLSTEMVFRTKFIDDIYPIPVGYHIWQDLRTVLVLSLLKINIYYINKPLGYHRLWHESLSKFASKNWIKWLMDERIAYLKIIHDRYKDIDISYEIWYLENRFIKRYNLPRFKILILVLIKYPKYFLFLLREFYANKIRFKIKNWF